MTRYLAALVALIAVLLFGGLVISSLNLANPMEIPSVEQTVTPALTNSINLYFVAINDQGNSGTKIGCGDSLVPVARNIEPTQAPLTEAIETLISTKDRDVENGLYNSLYQSPLVLDSARVDNGTATIFLSGNLMLDGVCDNPRVMEQLRATAAQFPTVENVQIFLNNRPLEEVLSQQ